MPSYSRRRPASKGPITAPTERTQCDAVTGEIVTTVLDGVQQALDQLRRTFEAVAAKHGLSQAERERLAGRLMLWAIEQVRHRDADLAALRALLAAMNERAG